jgi:NTP pyrophosphatase (non-canonical NTP hydrolase)
MNLSEYQQAALRTLNGIPDDFKMKCNVVFGIVGEAGEIADYMKKVLFHEHQVDKVKLSIELGDLMWYVSALASLYDLNLDEIAIGNVLKLQARYPNGFSKEDSQKRTV